MQFGVVWGLVFAAALLATTVGTVVRGRERGEQRLVQADADGADGPAAGCLLGGDA